MPEVQTVEQRRALCAANQIARLQAEQVEGYRQIARKLPAMLTTMGLGQSVAFLAAKDNDDYRRLLQHLQLWLIGADAPIAWSATDKQQTTLQQRLLVCSIGVYYQALEEALALAGWLKRLAEARSVQLKARPAPAGEGTD